MALAFGAFASGANSNDQKTLMFIFAIVSAHFLIKVLDYE